MTCTRRDALYSIGIAAAATTLPGCTSDGDGAGVPEGVAEMCGSDLCFKISANPELQSVGGIVVMNNGRIFVQRTGDATFSAISAICTHAACTVSFTGNGRFSCPCHGSGFNSDTGAVLNGPAVRPLTVFPTTVNGDDVTITLAT
jgi:Rieske Fe-S protein